MKDIFFDVLLALGVIGLMYVASCILLLVGLQARRVFDLCTHCKGRRAECISVDVLGTRELMTVCGRVCRHRRCRYNSVTYPVRRASCAERR